MTISESELMEVYERRKAESIPWFGDPLRYGGEGANDMELLQDKHESTTIELFFDLFFVANLAVFTMNHEINDPKSLRSYIGFFTFIWFTWLQVAFFDVRFSRDSVFERVCKSIHFGIMIGYAAVNKKYFPNTPGDHYMTLRTIGWLMMASRLVLAAQYGSVLWAIVKRRFKTAILPMCLIILVLLSFSMISLGITLSFHRHQPNKGYKLWYAGCVLEACLVIGVSLWKRMLSFKHSNLVERLGLLTLIILGEGIIGLSKNSSKIVQHEGWTSSTLSEVIAYTGTIYFLWMLYFDNHPRGHYGSIREQVWALFHFPFHIFLVLLPEGLGQFVVWRSVITVLRDLEQDFSKALKDVNYLGPKLGQKMKETLEATLNLANKPNQAAKFELAIQSISRATTAEQANYRIQKLMDKASEYVFVYFGVELPHEHVHPAAHGAKGHDHEKAAKLDQYFVIFRLVFEYFFLGTGVLMLLFAFFFFLVRRKKDHYDYASIAYRVSAGIIMFSIAALTADKKLVTRYITSVYVVPVVPLTLGLVILLDRLTNLVAIRRASGKSKKNRRTAIIHRQNSPGAPRPSMHHETFEYRQDSLYPTLGANNPAFQREEEEATYKDISLTPFNEKFPNRSPEDAEDNRPYSPSHVGKSSKRDEAAINRLDDFVRSPQNPRNDPIHSRNGPNSYRDSQISNASQGPYLDTLSSGTSSMFQTPQRQDSNGPYDLSSSSTARNPYTEIIAKVERDRERIEYRAGFASETSSLYSWANGPGRFGQRRNTTGSWRSSRRNTCLPEVVIRE